MRSANTRPSISGLLHDALTQEQEAAGAGLTRTSAQSADATCPAPNEFSAQAAIVFAVQRKEAAAAVGMGVDSFDRYVRPFIRVVYQGDLKLWPVAELERWVQENAIMPGTSRAAGAAARLRKPQRHQDG